MPDKSVLGIDLRVCSVKVVEFKKSSKGLEIIGWGMGDVSYDLQDKHPDKEWAQAELLKKIIQEKDLKSKNAHVVASGPDFFVKKMSLPIVSGQELSQAIKWKIKDDLNYSIEDAVVDFIMLPPKADPKEAEFLVASAQKQTLTRILDVIEKANLKLVSIVPVPIALFEAYKPILLQNNVVSIIYFGKRTTNVSFFIDQRFSFNREISIGGEEITLAMTGSLVSDGGVTELKYDEAEKIKRESGLPQSIDDKLYALVRPAIEKVENEISRTIEYFKSQEVDAQIQKIILTGGGSNTPHLLGSLSQSTGIPFETADPASLAALELDKVDKEKFANVSQQFSCAIGAALAAFSFKTVNLIPPELKDKWLATVRKYLNPAPVSLVFTAILLLVYLVFYYVSLNLNASIVNAKKELDQVRPQLLRLEELEKAMREVEWRRRDFKTIEISKIKIPRVLESISNNTPSQMLMESINVVEAEKRAYLKGVVFERGDTAQSILSKFILKMSKSPVFSKVELIQAVKSSGYLYDAYNFEVRASIKAVK